MNKTVLYTVGHSTHETKAFVALLKQHDITALCDVRSQPYSRYNPQYNREILKDEIKMHGIHYVYLGKELGARSDNAQCYANGQVQFARLARDETFQCGLTRLRNGASEHKIALMCAEKDPLDCHRMILVTRQLRGEFSVHHICADGAIETNQQAEHRLMKLVGIRPSALIADEDNIAAAYDKRGERIAYKRDAGKPESSK